MSPIGDEDVLQYFSFAQILDASGNDAAHIRVKSDLTVAPANSYTVSSLGSGVFREETRSPVVDFTKSLKCKICQYLKSQCYFVMLCCDVITYD